MAECTEELYHVLRLQDECKAGKQLISALSSLNLFRYCLLQIESQCQSAASVSSASANCHALNVTFTCGSIHVNYVLALLVSQAHAANVSIVTP